MLTKDKIIKGLARTFGGSSLIIVGLFLINRTGSNLIEIKSSYFQSMLILAGFSLMGYIFAWFRPKEGGYVLLFSGVIVGLTLFYQRKTFDFLPDILISVLFAISGLLFIWYDKFLPEANQEPFSDE